MKTIEQLAQDDNALDQHIGILLRAGVLLSAFIVLAGGMVLLVRHGGSIPDYHMFRGEPAHLRLIPQIISAAFHGHDLAIIQLGLLVLIATPVARVVFSVFAFAMERDWLYVVISGIVLAVLVYSLAGHAG